jgi:hypothetical protein
VLRAWRQRSATGWRGFAKRPRNQGSGFREQGSGFRVQGAGSRIKGSGFREQDSGFRVQGLKFKVQGFTRSQGLRVMLLHCRV